MKTLDIVSSIKDLIYEALYPFLFEYIDELLIDDLNNKIKIAICKEPRVRFLGLKNINPYNHEYAEIRIFDEESQSIKEFSLVI